MLAQMNCYGKNVIHMAGQHHEKWKGGGYPQKLEGDIISPFARICKIMDVYDALSTRRSYKKAMKPFDALILMRRKMADHFDPTLLDSFIRLMGPDM
jgi:HD-GYP domain-containing protein (c-di-GMP phosphodiesterase class II)